MLCNEMKELTFKIEWICEAQLGSFTRSILRLMKEAGCVRVKLGIESGTDRILKLMNKPFTKKIIREKVALVNDVGIECTAYALIGMPTETKEEMLETYRFIEDLDPKYISLSVAAPQPRTSLFEQAKEQGIISEEDFFKRSHQSFSSSLNSEVDDEVINKFIAFNEKKGYARSIWAAEE